MSLHGSGYQQMKPSTRVADYFLVVGADDQFDHLMEENAALVSKVTDLVLRPHVLDRYPVVDRTDTSFPAGIFVFCHPSGFSISDHALSPSFHSFVHTSESGARVFGSCLTIYEKLDSTQRSALQEHFPSLELDPSGATDTSPPSKYYLPKCLCVTSSLPFVSEIREILCQIYRISIQPSAVPIERFICNFVDDVPAPVAGLVDVSYFCGVDSMAEVLFRAPPVGHPRAWSSLPLRPLFECLSPDNVRTLLAAVLVERQVVFVSSQFSLLTVCAEAITSLLFPLCWSHVYVPVLPKALLGMLSAPVPFIVGLHSSFLADARESCPQLEALLVHVDENRLECGFDNAYVENVAPPTLPRRSAVRLTELLEQMGSAAFDNRGARWETVYLPLFDSAFGNAATPWVMAGGDGVDEAGDVDAEANGHHSSERGFSEIAVRRGFMALFVELLKNYRRHLVYAGPEGAAQTKSWKRFRADDFLAEHPVESRPFMKEFLTSQAFAQFVSERVSLPASFGQVSSPGPQPCMNRNDTADGKDKGSGFPDESSGSMDFFAVDHLDGMFFDEQIDLQQGRGAMRRYFSEKMDRSPALGRLGLGLGTGAKVELRGHVKTFVPPLPDTFNLPPLEANTAERVYQYDLFPRLDATLFVPVRQDNPLASARNQALRARGFARLRRYGGQSSGPGQGLGPVQLSIPGDRSPKVPVGGGRLQEVAGGEAGSAMACSYSCYLAVLCSAITQVCSHKVVVAEAPPPAASSTHDNIFIPAPVVEPGRDIDSGEEEGGADLFRYYNMDRDSLSASEGEEEDGMGPLDYSHTYVPMVAPCSCPSSAGNRCPACATEAAVALLRVAVEVLNTLSFYDEVPSDHVYRGLAQACGACGDVVTGLSLLVHLRGEDVVPDFAVLSAVASTIARHNERVRATIDATKRHPSWVDRYMQMQQRGPTPSPNLGVSTGSDQSPIRSRSVSSSGGNLLNSGNPGSSQGVSSGAEAAELWTMLYSARMNPVDVWGVPALSQEKGFFEPGGRLRPKPDSEAGRPPMWHELLAQAYEEEKQCYALQNILRTFSGQMVAEVEMAEKGRLLDDRRGTRRRARLSRQFSKLVGPGGGTASPAPQQTPLDDISLQNPAELSVATDDLVKPSECGVSDEQGSMAAAAAGIKAKVSAFLRRRSASADTVAGGDNFEGALGSSSVLGSRERSPSPVELSLSLALPPVARSPAPSVDSDSESTSSVSASRFPRMPAAHEVQWSWAGTSPIIHIYPSKGSRGIATAEQEERERAARDALEISTHEKLERDSRRSVQAQFADAMVRRSGTVLAKLGLKQDPGNRKLSYCRNTDPKVSYAASQEFSDLVRESEKYVGLLFPNVVVDFTNPGGTCCSAAGCGQRQTVEHVQAGWTPHDANDYGSRCWSCRATYVPHFTVFCTLHNSWWKGISTDLGLINYNAVAACTGNNYCNSGSGAGEATPESDHCLWCPLLSPWVLMKEVQSVLCADSRGVAALLSHDFVASSSQNAVVFWNLIVTFKRFGLPYATLLCNNSLCSLFNNAIFMNNLPGRQTAFSPDDGL